ncbi:MAG: hypothetical protein CMP51_03550 [Flavobacteriales bacterium]|nr:hypothetical protein [Flavobacteriales bacterium]|tara:strand:- start:185 stop:553 length:369 start_codon:yes stop_codon:yes gene_type:complete
MSLSIKGTLKKKLDIEQGTSKSGNEWKSQSFILNTGEQYNPDICFKLFGDEKIKLIENLNEGEEISVMFNLYSREWNDKWYTSADAWKIEKTDSNSQDFEIIDESEIPVFENNQTEEDDLPF